MPRLLDLRHQMTGLWLLVQGDARGLSHFDISDDGVIRSFWAWVYCLPPLVFYAILRRIEFLQVLPDPGRYSLTYGLQVMVVETAGWTASILAVVVFGFLLGIRPLVRTLVVALNWAAVPALWVSYGPLFALVMLPGQSTLLWLLQMSALLASIVLVVALSWRMLHTVIGGNWLRRAAYLLLICLPPLYTMHSLERSMGLVLP
ncbi:hypothetical protein [Rhizobium sp. FY34]|uniref:hypothetical protein n=1 Tax=Rhizobium sp. FY34 TaxID=2562309 RepID=UPI0010C06040|nr:hypothetical protein [Rhizobium sp. FY34]